MAITKKTKKSPIVNKKVKAKVVAKKATPKIASKVKSSPTAKKAKPSPKVAPKKPVAKVKGAAKPIAKTAKPATKVVKDIKVVASVKKEVPVKKESIKKNTGTPSKVAVKEAPVKVKAEVKAVPPPPPPVKKKEPINYAKIVIPKTTVKTSITYKPDFTTSVLDKKAKDESETPMLRYSDVELLEFKELINKKLDAAKKELVYLQGLITRKDDMGGDNDDGRYMTMEDGSLSMEREQLSQMASRQITFVDHLEKALMRIENKTYGICRVTGKLIDKARLRAVPHATLSVEAKMSKS